MNKRLFFLLAAILLILPLTKTFAQNEIFLRKVEFELTKLGADPADNEFFLTLQFNKGTKYKFKVLNHINGTAGEAVIELKEGEKLVGTNNIGEKYFDQCMFQCSKTGFYNVVLKFRNNQLGNSVIDVYMIQ